MTDIKTNNFYRCLSHQYPYVKAATIWKQETKHLVLQFWGHEKFPSVAIPFRAKNQEDESKQVEMGPFKLQGTFINDHDEE